MNPDDVAESLPPHRVDVSPAAPEQEPVLANLLELYTHDLSEFFDMQVEPSGRFGYPWLSRYWHEEGRFPFLVHVDGQIAGLALISRGSRISDDPQIWDMAEFFIMRRYRKRGIGTTVAAAVWRRFPGWWEVRVLESNQPARAFWTAAIESFTNTHTEATRRDLQQKDWRVFSFESPNLDQSNEVK